MRDLAARARRRSWRTWYAAKWRLWQRREQDRVRLRRVAGLDLVVLPGMFDPAWFLSSDVLADAIGRLVGPGDRVLDLGSGTGIGALAAIRAGAASVVATDLDAVALRCTRANLAIDGTDLADRVSVRAGDLFAPVAGERFDLVAFNPPWLRVRDTGMDAALRVQPATARRFADELAGHLTLNGCAVLILSTHGRPASWLDPLRAAGHTIEAVVARDRGSEVITAWAITPSA